MMTTQKWYDTIIVGICVLGMSYVAHRTFEHGIYLNLMS